MAYPSIWLSVSPEIGNTRKVNMRLMNGSTPFPSHHRAWRVWLSPAPGAAAIEPSGFLMGAGTGCFLAVSRVANKHLELLTGASGAAQVLIVRTAADTTWLNAMCEGVWKEVSVAFV